MEQSEISTALGRSPLSNYEFLRLKEQMQINHMNRVERLRYSTDASLFSTSLPAMFHEKLNLRDEEDNLKSIDGRVSDLNKLVQGSVALNHSQSTKCQDLGNLPDDEEELLAGIIESFDLNGLLSGEAEESEEYDLFISGGGLELDFDTHENGSTNISGSLDSFINNGSSYVGSNVAGALPGEHPYGEHPSRTLFVRNINSNVEDSELRALFEQYGTIRALYTACKHRGFVMISYYDIRAARSAMRALQNKPLRRRKLDIHFSIPKDNPSEKDVNQGTLVVFNLDPSVSNEDLLHIFGAFGEVKEIRETPHKRHHKFIEFYDVRAAEEALKHLNRIDIAGKRIKLEPSRPGGTRRSLIQHLSQESEQDDTRSYRPQTGSPVTSSPPVGSWVHFHSPSEEGSFQNIHHSPGVVNGNSFTQKPLPGLGAVLPHMMSPSANIIHTGNEMGSQFHHPHSFPENGSMLHMPHYGSPVTCGSPSYGPPGAIGVPNGGPYPQAKSTPVSSTLSRPQFHWSTQPSYGVQNPAWPPGFTPNGTQAQHPGFLYPGRHSYMNPVQLASHHPHPHHHHVGSAPPEETFHHGYFAEPSEPSFMQPRSFNGVGFVNGSPMMNVGGVAMSGNGVVDNGSPSFALRSAQQACHMYPPGPHPGPIPIPGDAPERVRNRRAENTANQADNKKQYQLDLDKIISGEDTRTTLMIKNIPNKYTSKMLLAAIDEHHRGTYDFLYLPIDFKNKCNVGYAFLNMTSPSHIISFYKTFNGKKWEKFNSEKVASIAYARIQGKAALVTHFQNSSLMNEDKRCRPILFHSDGPEEPFPLTINHKVRPNENPSVGDRSSPSPASKDEGEKANFHAENVVEKAKSGSAEDAEL